MKEEKGSEHQKTLSASSILLGQQHGVHKPLTVLSAAKSAYPKIAGCGKECKLLVVESRKDFIGQTCQSVNLIMNSTGSQCY